MRNFLLLILLCLPPLLLVGQDKAGVTYNKHVILSGKNVKGDTQDTLHLGGLSAIEYMPANSSKPARWIFVSDKNRVNKKSYSFMADSLADLSTISLSKPTPFFTLEDVESVRYNPALKKYFYVTENDTGSSVGYIGDDSTGHKLFTELLVDGRITTNRGIESLTFGPDKALWIAYESGGSTRCDEQAYTYFYRVPFDATKGTIAEQYDFKKKEEYLYDFSRCACLNNAQFDKNFGNGISEILMYDANHILVLERCYDGSKATVNLYLATINSVNKTISKGKPVFDFNCLANFPDAIQFLPDNLEGMTWGPDKDGKRQLYLISDNNFNTIEKHRQSTQLVVLSVDPKKIEEKLTADAKKAIEAKSNQSCVCKLSPCTCKPKPVQSRITSLVFNNEGKIISKMPAVLKDGDVIEVTVNNTPLTAETTEFGKQFKKSQDYWKDTTTKLDEITGSIGFSDKSSVSDLIGKQFTDHYEPLTPFFSYSLAINGGDPTALPSLPSSFTIHTKPDQEKITLSLSRNQTDNQFLREVFSKHKEDYKGWEVYKSTFDSLYPRFITYAAAINGLSIKQKLVETAGKDSSKCITCSSISDIKTDSLLCNYLDNVQAVQTQLCAIVNTVINDNKGWMRSWLWYSGGKPVLNPFGFISAYERNALIDRKLASNEELLKLYHSLSTGCCDTDTKGTIDKLKKPISQLTQEIVDLKKEQATGKKREDDYKATLKNLAQSNLLLNKTLLFVSNEGKINWMNHYDALDEYTTMNPENSLPDWVYEKDRVQAIVHNLAINQKVSAQQSVKGIALRTELDIQTDAFSKAFATGLSQRANIAKISIPGEMMALSTAGVAPDSVECTIEKRKESFRTVLALVEWLHKQTEPPVDDLQTAFEAFNTEKPTPAFQSQDVFAGLSRTTKGTNQITYEISEAGKDKPVVKDSFQTYTSIRWWPFVSINYVLGSRAVSIFDNTTKQFRTDTDIDNFEAIAGAKWYLKSSNITRTHKRTKFIRDALGDTYNKERGNLGWSKAFLFLGLGVSHNFLKNYGLGAGYDISPGFSVQVGANVFFRKSYELDNGQIKRQFDIPSVRGFFGISIDPNVVTKLISLF